MAKTFIVFALVLFLFQHRFALTAYAGETGGAANIADNAVFILDSVKIQDNKSGKLFFLFSSAQASKNNSGDIFCFFSELDIAGSFEGGVYALFSKVNLEEGAQFNGSIHTFSSEVFNKARLPLSNIIKPLLPSELFINPLFVKSDGAAFYSDKIPGFIFNICLGVAQFLLCIIIFAAKKSFAGQGSVLLFYQPSDIINCGLSAYAIFIALSLVFMLSVVFFPLTVLFLFIAYLAAMVGETALAVTVGYLLTSRLFLHAKMHAKRRFNIHVNLLVGLAVIEGVRLIPYVSIAMSFVFLPILAMGTVITAFINGYVKKIFYELPYAPDFDKKSFSKSQIRDIILK